MSRTAWNKIFRFGQIGQFAYSQPRCPTFFQTVCSHFGRSERFAYFAYSCPKLSYLAVSHFSSSFGRIGFSHPARPSGLTVPVLQLSISGELADS
ncbi:hypothetical protein KI387_010295, partial [Taxus chinensis]